MFNYGLILSNGEGIDLSLQKAVIWFKRVTELCQIEAMFNYGKLVYNGEGIKCNYKEVVFGFKEQQN
jgi:TPR repeat protein